MSAYKCPNCGLGILTMEFREKGDDAPIRTPTVGSMFLCGNCGDCLRLEADGTLQPWTEAVPEAIAKVSSGIKMVRARRRAWGKALLN